MREKIDEKRNKTDKNAPKEKSNRNGLSRNYFIII